MSACCSVALSPPEALKKCDRFRHCNPFGTKSCKASVTFPNTGPRDQQLAVRKFECLCKAEYRGTRETREIERCDTRREYVLQALKLGYSGVGWGGGGVGGGWR